MWADGPGKSFIFLQHQPTGPQFTQELFGVSGDLGTDQYNNTKILGGVAFAPNGDAWASECLFENTILHRFAADGTTVSGETGISLGGAGGCGLVNHPDGFMYSASLTGLWRLDASTGAVITGPMGEPGNALGVAVDPLVRGNAHHIVYVGQDCHYSSGTWDEAFENFTPTTTCTLFDVDPTDPQHPKVFARIARSPGAFIDGLYFDPSGQFLFAAHRDVYSLENSLVILKRPAVLLSLDAPADGGALNCPAAPPSGSAFAQCPIHMESEPDGVAFHATEPRFVVTLNESDDLAGQCVNATGATFAKPASGCPVGTAPVGGTMTRFDFPTLPGSTSLDFTQPPTSQTFFAMGGFRGDLLQVGPDACLYATQGRLAVEGGTSGVRYNDGTVNPSSQNLNSLVKICGNFALPPGVGGHIGDFVWRDVNGNGVQDAGEPGIAGVEIVLRGSDSTVLAVTTSDASGAYSFENVPYGSYTVEVTAPPAGLVPTGTGAGTPGTDSNTSPASVTVSRETPSDHTIAFGYKAGRISGYAFCDTDNNHIRSNDELSIADVEISLTSPTGSSNQTTTLAGYTFGDLVPGSYTLSAPTTVAGNTLTWSPASVTLAEGAFQNDLNFAYSCPGSGDTPAPGIKIVESTNGTDHTAGSTATVESGSTVVWTYEVTNTGNVPLSNIVITDDNGTPGNPADDFTPTFNPAGDTNSNGKLDTNETWTYSASGTAAPGEHTNVGSATGTPPTGASVSSTDSDSYFGSAPAITLVKLTNGADHNAVPGVYIPVGDAVVWTYQITNSGNVDLTGVTVTDDRIGAICVVPTLAHGQSTSCTAQGTATAGQYTNTGTVIGTPPVGANVTASDPDNYFGATSGITIVETTNGTNNDTTPGLYVEPGSTITLTYTVTNTGNVPLTNVTVTDDQGGTVTCPASTLSAGETMTCTQIGTATPGSHTNVGTVVGTPPVGPNVTASNPDSYFGSAPGIAIVKNTNGTDNNAAPGPYVAVGSTVTWTYLITNTGNVALSNIVLTDDKVGAVTCPATTLSVGANMTCTKTGSAVAGQYTNIGTVTGQSPLNQTVTASNPDNYFGVTAGITIVKTTNGTDNNVAPGPSVAVGSTVTWTYLITNTGNVTLTNVTLTDDKVGAVGCPQTTLAPGANMSCTKTGTAVAGQYTNMGTVTGTPPVGPNVSASNPDNYFGSAPGIAIVKNTNGTDNNVAPGPYVAVGSTVIWTYVISNTGNVALSNIALTDDKVGAITCPATTLAVGANMTCTKTGSAVAGQYTNVGTVTGKSALNQTVSGSNPDNYFGVAPGIRIVKKTNGTDNDATAGPTVFVGSTVTWTYEVQNIGNVTLSNVVVTDNKIAGTICTIPTLASGASWTCTKTGTAVSGPYTNTGTVVGTPPGGLPTVTASNVDHYVGVLPSGLNGYVYVDANRNQTFDAGEATIGGVTVTLSNGATTTSAANGSYSFSNLTAGSWSVSAPAVAGDKGLFTASPLTVTLAAGEVRPNLNFGYVTLVSVGDTGSVGYWKNSNGQALIKAMNGGPTAKNMANWLASNFPYLYGANSSNNLTNKTNNDVAALFVTFFNQGSPKTNAQMMGAAIAAYVTSSTLAGGNYAAAYGFTVTPTGCGGKSYNVGASGTAIGLVNDKLYTVIQLLQQANLRKQQGTFDSSAFSLIFGDINQSGHIV